MKELEVKSMLKDSRIPEQYKLGGRLSSEFLDGVEFAEQRIMEKGMEVWLARDIDGNLWAFKLKPYHYVNRRDELVWRNDDSPQNYIYLGGKSFPEVTFENSPVKARIILED
jgi:hypothetical protein